MLYLTSPYRRESMLADIESFVPTAKRDNKAITVGVFDDEVMLLKAHKRSLKYYGFKCRTHPEPLAGPDNYMGFDVVLTDWDMPGGGGERVVIDCIARNIPVVVLTGSSDEAKAVVCGQAAVLSKGSASTEQVHDALIAAIEGAE